MSNNYSIIKSYAKSPEIIRRFAEIVGEPNAQTYIYSVLIAVSTNDQLKQCTPQSILKSAARAATLYLTVDPSIGQAYLVPYKDEATLIIGWRGLRDLAYRTGKVRIMNVGKLYDGQKWVEDQLTGEAHIEGSRSGDEILGYFAYLETKDRRTHSLYMTVDEIHEHKKRYAHGFNRQNSAWNTNFDEMAKKTVLRQLLTKWAELDPIKSFANIESLDAIDDMPDPDSVTIEKPEQKTSDQILDELGFDPSLNSVDDISEQNTGPGATEAPKSTNELYKWAAQGQIPGVGVRAAKEAVEATKTLDDAWEIVLMMSKGEIDKVSDAAEQQPELI